MSQVRPRVRGEYLGINRETDIWQRSGVGIDTLSGDGLFGVVSVGYGEGWNYVCLR